MKKNNYLAAAFAIVLSVAFTSCSKTDDIDASMLPPGSTMNTEQAALVSSGTNQDATSADILQNSSACKCPGPDVGSVDTTGID